MAETPPEAALATGEVYANPGGGARWPCAAAASSGWMSGHDLEDGMLVR